MNLAVDEMIVLDINATKNNQIDFDIISDLASECFMPLSYGGLKTLKDAERIFRLGIEKIVIILPHFQIYNLFNNL